MQRLGKTSPTKDVHNATIYFLARDTAYERVKPYSLRFAPAAPELPQSNVKREPISGLSICDLRSCAILSPDRPASAFEKVGFTVLNLNSQMQYEDFKDHGAISRVYLAELEARLMEVFNAARVEVFEHAIRKRDRGFPISRGTEFEFDQPTLQAHVDATVDETLSIVRRLNRGHAESALNGRYQYVNIWKPLRGPLNDWPLALCDASTVDPEHDLVAADLVYKTYATENYQVHYSPKQTWYYLSDQMPDEILVFRQADSRPGGGPGVPHSSFFNPHAAADEPPRESIEARAIIYHDAA